MVVVQFFRGSQEIHFGNFLLFFIGVFEASQFFIFKKCISRSTRKLELFHFKLSLFLVFTFHLTEQVIELVVIQGLFCLDATLLDHMFIVVVKLTIALVFDGSNDVLCFLQLLSIQLRSSDTLINCFLSLDFSLRDLLLLSILLSHLLLFLLDLNILSEFGLILHFVAEELSSVRFNFLRVELDPVRIRFFFLFDFVLLVEVVLLWSFASLVGLVGCCPVSVLKLDHIYFFTK